MAHKPNHLAIIMDGNGRWAQKKLFPRTRGHRAAVKSVESVIEACVKFNIPILSLFAFGRDNWQRPKSEIQTLMQLFSEVLHNQVPQLQKNNVQLNVIGDRAQLDSEVCKQIDQSQQATSQNDGLILNIAIDYSGQWDIMQATKTIAQNVEKGHVSSDMIDEAMIENALSGAMKTPIDLLIRTSGEQRISNFALWQLAYAELYFCQTLWPDFRVLDLEKALEFYAARQRRFGKTAEQLQ